MSRRAACNTSGTWLPEPKTFAARRNALTSPTERQRSGRAVRSATREAAVRTRTAARGARRPTRSSRGSRASGHRANPRAKAQIARSPTRTSTCDRSDANPRPAPAIRVAADEHSRHTRGSYVCAVAEARGRPRRAAPAFVFTNLEVGVGIGRSRPRDFLTADALESVSGWSRLLRSTRAAKRLRRRL